MNNLYQNSISLCNQKFYTKNEFNNKLNIIDITDGFNDFCVQELNYSENQITTKGYTETSNSIVVDLTDYLDSTDNLQNGLRFKLYSNYANDYLMIMVDEESAVIMYNPEILRKVNNMW